MDASEAVDTSSDQSSDSLPGQTHASPEAEEFRPGTRWGFAFIAVLGYVAFEYLTLQATYPILEPLSLGKVTILSAIVGSLFFPRKSAFVCQERKQMDLALVLVLVAAFIGCPFAEHETIAWNNLQIAMIFATVYFIISRVVNSPWRIKTFIFFWLLVNLKLAQFVVRMYQTLTSEVGEVRVIREGIGGGYNKGFFSNAADFGVAMAIVWPIALCLLYAKPKRIYKILLLAGVVLFLWASLVCGSRGALVGIAGSALVLLLKNAKRITVVLGIALLGVAVWAALPDVTKTRFSSATDPDKDLTAHHRLLLWRAGLHMFKDHPVMGVGIGNYALVRRDHYPIDLWTWAAAAPHSLYIQGLSELGVLGTIPLIFLFLWVFKLNRGTRKILNAELGDDSKKTFEYCLALGLDLGFVGYMASGAFVAVLWYPHLFVLTGLTAALNQIVRDKYGNSQFEASADT